jgi:hypothetical protein
MKTQTRTILKSLTDLPADTFALAASVPERALAATRQALSPPVRMTRRQIRAARRRSAEFMNSIRLRVLTPLQLPPPWPRGGLNE